MELTANEAHLYFSQPERITDPALLRRYESLLTADELTRMSRFYFARHRHQYLVTRALIRTTLSSYFPVDPADWRFGKNTYGKPEISLGDTTWPIHFNLSHCDGLVLCGVTREVDIGVDVEDTQRPAVAAPEQLSSYFSETEIEELTQLPKEKRQSRFFDYWTLKESYIKARGQGLSLGLDQFSFNFPESGRILIAFENDSADSPDNWQFELCRPGPKHIMAVAIRQNTRNKSTVEIHHTVPLTGELRPSC